MNKNQEELEKILEQVFLKYIKVVGDEDQTYYSTPTIFIRAIVSAILSAGYVKLEDVELQWQDRVCTYCGGKLEMKPITDNFGGEDIVREQVVCMPCSRIEVGTSERNFSLASDMVKLKHFTHYSYDVIEDEEQRIKADISYYCGVIKFIFHAIAQAKDKIVKVKGEK